MIQEIKYTDAPKEVEESLSRAKIVPNFEITPEQIRAFATQKAKKPISIYLSVETIEKFKQAAEKTGSRYQTMISDVLDIYTQQYL